MPSPRVPPLCRLRHLYEDLIMTSPAPNEESTPASGPEPARREGAWHPRRSLAVFGVVVLISLGAAWVWRNDEARTRTVSPVAPMLVTTALALEQDVPVFRVGVGTVTAQQSVTVKVRVDGQLDRVSFIEGQDVKAGQLLAQIDPRPIQAQVDQAQAQRARDLAQVANARADLVRCTNLLAQDASTRQQVDTQQALVAQLEAQVQLDDAQIHYQQVQLAYTRIVAPIAGRTGVRLVDAGNIVHVTDTTGPNALTVPAAAIQRSQDGTFVWRVDPDDKVGAQPVDVASIQDGLAVIRKGLQAQERVVVAGQYKLRDGTLVAESRPAVTGATGTAVAENDAASGASATLR